MKCTISSYDFTDRIIHHLDAGLCSLAGVVWSLKRSPGIGEREECVWVHVPVKVFLESGLRLLVTVKTLPHATWAAIFRPCFVRTSTYYSLFMQMGLRFEGKCVNRLFAWHGNWIWSVHSVQSNMKKKKFPFTICSSSKSRHVCSYSFAQKLLA